MCFVVAGHSAVKPILITLCPLLESNVLSINSGRSGWIPSFRFSIMWGSSTPLRRVVIQMRAGMRVGKAREVVVGMGGGALVQFFQKYNIRNITCTHVVLNFIFECSTTFECLTKVSTVNE